jgi:dihydroorotate dehydrogenase electron transfer subunit
MPAPPADARSILGTAAGVVRCGDDGVILRVETDRAIAPIRAGRFFMLRREDRVSPAIPRPFSVYQQRGRELRFLIKVMGTGTQALADCTPGTKVRLVGPLGNGWPALDGDGAPWVMLGGGIGSVPFYRDRAGARGDGRRKPARKDQLLYVYGAARKGLLYDLEAFQSLGVRVATCTDDGSFGFKGNVLQLLGNLQKRKEIPEKVRILACGPERMLEAVEQHANERGLEAWLALENLMGCGVGICNGCPVTTRPEGAMELAEREGCVEGRSSRRAT